jgi:lysozyme
MTSSPLAPSPWLFDYLRSFLAFRPTAYRAHRGAPWVIGYNHTAGVKPGDTCTVEQAKAWLREDIATAADECADLIYKGALDVAVALRVAGL